MIDSIEIVRVNQHRRDLRVSYFVEGVEYVKVISTQEAIHYAELLMTAAERAKASVDNEETPI